MRGNTVGKPLGKYQSLDRNRTAPSAPGTKGTNLANFSDFAPGLGHWPVRWQPIGSLCDQAVSQAYHDPLALNDRFWYSSSPVGLAGTLKLWMHRTQKAGHDRNARPSRPQSA